MASAELGARGVELAEKAVRKKETKAEDESIYFAISLKVGSKESNEPTVKNRFPHVVDISPDRYLYRCTHLTLDSTCAVDHGPRVVEIGPFSVDVFPVTNERYREFLVDSGYEPAHGAGFLRHWNGRSVPSGLDRHPVVWVTPEDAAAFASWAGGRLPTDEEWQYIACGPEEKKWPWGEELDASRCNHEGGELMPVDAYPQGVSWCGCYDLSGNAWEWTAPIHDDQMHRFALLRGGSYFRGPAHWHVAGGARPGDFHWKVQLTNDENNRFSNVGFRCVYGAES